MKLGKRTCIALLMGAAFLGPVGLPWPTTMAAAGQAATLSTQQTVVDYPVQERDIWCKNQGQRIYGKLYMPQTGKQKVPLVIFSHELAASHKTGTGYAKALAARGAAVYVFDYRGGGPESRSDGKTTDMSVMTEVSDLETVLSTARSWDFVDNTSISRAWRKCRRNTCITAGSALASDMLRTCGITMFTRTSRHSQNRC